MAITQKRATPSGLNTLSTIKLPETLAPDFPNSVIKRMPELAKWKADLDEGWTLVRRAVQESFDAISQSIEAIPVVNDLTKTWALENPVAGLSSVLLQSQGNVRITKLVATLAAGTLRAKFTITSSGGQTTQVIVPWMEASSTATTTVTAFSNALLQAGDFLSGEIVSADGVTTGSIIVFYRESK